MKSKELKKIKSAFSYLYEYSRIGFYGTIFLMSYIAIYVVQVVLSNIIHLISKDFFIPNNTIIYVITISLSFILTFIVYICEEKAIKELTLIKIKIMKKYNKKNIDEKVFSKILLDLIKELEKKKIINLSKKNSNISKKEFKTILKNRLEKEKSDIMYQKHQK